MSELLDMGIAALAQAMEKGRVSAEETTRAYLAQIEKEDPRLGLFLTPTPEKALAAARKVDDLRAEKRPLPPLAGIPMALKDNICTEGIRTTCAGKMLAHFVPACSAAVAQRLEAQGAVLLGKLNMDEFAMGSSGESSAFGPAQNPLDPTRVPGGSSGGSAAAVAARCALFTLGSDTGGSIRQPAAFCGVVGLRPSYGRVSRRGLVAFASSMDQIGPLTRTVEDCALVLQAISGHDPEDATSSQGPVPSFTRGLQEGVKGMRIALPGELMEGAVPAVRQAVLEAARLLEAQGARVEPLPGAGSSAPALPCLKAAVAAYYILSSAEAASNLARFDGVRYGARAPRFESTEALYTNTRSQSFGPEVKRRILLGTLMLSAGYNEACYQRARQARAHIRAELEQLLEGYDLLLCPTTPTPPWRRGEKSDPPEAYREDLYTVPASLAGLPALSLPVPWNFATGPAAPKGAKAPAGEAPAPRLPIGVQLVGRPFGEAPLLRAAYSLEQALPLWSPARGEG